MHSMQGGALNFAVGSHVSYGSYSGCTVCRLHADGSVDINIPGVGIHPRVARSAVRLVRGIGGLPHTLASAPPPPLLMPPPSRPQSLQPPWSSLDELKDRLQSAADAIVTDEGLTAQLAQADVLARYRVARGRSTRLRQRKDPVEDLHSLKEILFATTRKLRRIDNPLALPGMPLYERFAAAFAVEQDALGEVDRLRASQMLIRLAVHGTPAVNIESLCRNGFDPDRRVRQRYGPGDYLSSRARTAIKFTDSYNDSPLGLDGLPLHTTRLVLCAVLVDQSSASSERVTQIHDDESTKRTFEGDVIVVRQPTHTLPLAVVEVEALGVETVCASLLFDAREMSAEEIEDAVGWRTVSAPPAPPAPPSPPAPPAPPATDDGVEMLAAMFPTYDKEILSIILADNSNIVEAAMDQLLQMGEGGGEVSRAPSELGAGTGTGALHEFRTSTRTGTSTSGTSSASTSTSTSTRTGTSTSGTGTSTSSSPSLDPITLEPLGADGEPVIEMPCAGSAQFSRCTFNRSTVLWALRCSARCPGCDYLLPSLPGPQPAGRMSIERHRLQNCEGHEQFGTLVVAFSFPCGVQGAQHISPGQRYEGVLRTGFYPDNEEGQACVRLLRRAFERGRAFIVGSSLTTGRENTVVYAIHQKSRSDGGAALHGWPDPTYLQRLSSECAAFGIYLEECPPL